MAAKSLKTCPSCGHMWESATPSGAPCPRCGKANRSAETKTPPPGSIPAVRPAAPAPAPARPAVSQRPVSGPPKSHFFRNIFAVVFGLVVAAVVLHFTGIFKLPHTVLDPVEKMARKVSEAAGKAAPEKPKEPDKHLNDPHDKPPDVKPPVVKAPPGEPSPDFSKEKSYEVLKVEDGGTIVVKGETKNISVHFLGVSVAKPGDAPVHGVRDGSETREWMKLQLPKGQKVFLYYGILDSPKWRAEREAFGSDRAWVFRASDGVFLNLELVREGYGRADTKGAKEFEELLNYWDDQASGKRQ